MSIYFQFQCVSAPLSDDDIDYGHWIDRNGDPQVYFDGKLPGIHTCACGKNQSCFDPIKTCNCDSNNPVIEQDQGKNYHFLFQI